MITIFLLKPFVIDRPVEAGLYCTALMHLKSKMVSNCMIGLKVRAFNWIGQILPTGIVPSGRVCHRRGHPV